MKKILLLTFIVMFGLAACFHSGTPPEAVQPPATAPAPTPAPTPTPTPLPLPAPAVKVKTVILALDAGNIFFKPKSFTVKANQPVTVNFTNKGSHTFTIDELGVHVKLQEASGSFTFTPTKTGSFTFYCSVPGHRQAGQFGTITVTE